MSTHTLLNPQTAATNNEPSLILQTDNYDNIVAFATGLAGAETVGIFVTGGAVDIPYSVGGAAVSLTATQPMQALPPGPTYRFAKGATAGGVGIYATLDA